MQNQALLEAIINTAIEKRVFPGAVLGVFKGGQSNILPFGRLTYEAASPAVTPETVYDVASITKSIPTSSIIISLLQEKKLALDDQVITYLPELNNQYREQVLIRHLLTYTFVIDLPKGLASYGQTGAKNVMATIFSTPLAAPPGQKYYYTNAPAIFLALIAERVTGQPLDRLAQELFFDPLGMKSTTFRPKEMKGIEIAPTEIDWRGQVRAEVHDEAAWALFQAGIIPGNAGLFSTAGDLLRFMTMLIGGGRDQNQTYFQPEYLELMSTNQIDPAIGSVGLGWEVDWSNLVQPNPQQRLIGKTGFTGCLVLADRRSETAMVLISNRTYPHRPDSPAAMNEVRRALIPLIFDL